MEDCTIWLSKTFNPVFVEDIFIDIRERESKKFTRSSNVEISMVEFMQTTHNHEYPTKLDYFAKSSELIVESNHRDIEASLHHSSLYLIRHYLSSFLPSIAHLQSLFKA